MSMIKKNQVEDVHISAFKPLSTPNRIKELVAISPKVQQDIASWRRQICDVIKKRDSRKLVIVGPCSIHDPSSALEYAKKLQALAQEVRDSLILIMRCYFEKPRTTVGWKGFINDPFLDNSFNMNAGLGLARKLLLDISKLSLPLATEALEPISPQYLADFISWTAIGARTTESQTHRELASGLSSAVGFKNNTDGNIEVALNAMKSAQRPHHFLGIDGNGRTSIVSTKGNSYSHLILRGGKTGPNYHKESIEFCQKILNKEDLCPSMVIDCSHDNSQKNYKFQVEVFENCLGQIIDGNQDIVGLMLESHLYEGKQDLSKDLKYGVSITDACLGFEESARVIRDAHKRLSEKK